MHNEHLELAINQYCTIRKLGAKTKKLHLLACDAYGTYLGRTPLISDLDDMAFAEFIAWREKQVAVETVRGECHKLLAVWRWCAGPRRAWVMPPEVEIPESSHEPPMALDRRGLRMLWSYVEKLTGTIGYIPESIYWLALFYVLWDTSERIGAVYQIRREDIDLRRRWITVYSGTRKGRKKVGRVYRIRRSTARALKRLIAFTDAREPFSTCITSNAIYKRWRKMRAEIGLPVWATFHSIRRSHASHLTVAGGDARKSLGHDSQATTDRSYNDPRITKNGRQPCDMLFDPLSPWQRFLSKLGWLWG